MTLRTSLASLAIDEHISRRTRAAEMDYVLRVGRARNAYLKALYNIISLTHFLSLCRVSIEVATVGRNDNGELEFAKNELGHG